MHWPREAHRQRPHVLYMFRTPGGVRVGRDPLDLDVRQRIERQHPEIAFDWRAVRESQQLVEADGEPWRRRVRRADDRGAAREVTSDSLDAGQPSSAEVTTDVQPAQPPVPAVVQGSTPAEQAAFLTEWHSRIRERVPQRTSEPARQEVLFALAERLNPATWTDPDSGLQQASEALRRLSSVFAKRRRRSRRQVASVEPGADDQPAGS
jgi:hypothetical protein